jgi:tetratricopeptide (TPR) repeat protein
MAVQGRVGDFALPTRDPYSEEVMLRAGAVMRWSRMAWVVVGMFGLVGSVGAQPQVDEAARSEAEDAAAREQFVLGRAAYRGAHYDAALAHFRRAYELSGRSALLYNVGISADRLGNDEEAIEAFEKYLEETPDPSREQEVQERLAFLRLKLEEMRRKEQLAADAAAREATAAPMEAPSGRKVSRSAIIGGSVLGAVGVAGVAIMAVGLSQNGACVETDSSGGCTSERATTAWTTVYGSIGIAALAGSALWFGMGHRRANRERATTWNISPSGVMVSGTF